MDSLISVIVPVYNVEPYLVQCIESIQNQSHHNLDIILIDDGSKDNCGKICDEFAAKDSRIRIIHQINAGLSAARNAGLDIAIGQYIAFVDSDDFISTNMYEILLEKLITAEADMAICSFSKVDIDGNPTKINSPIKDEIFVGLDVFQKLHIRDYWHYETVWCRLYKKEIFHSLRFPEKKINEDVFVTYDIYKNAKKVVTIQTPLYFYRDVQNSIMHNKPTVRNLDGIEAAYRSFIRCEKEHKELMPSMYCLAMHQLNRFRGITYTNRQECLRKKEVKKMIRYMYFKVAEKKNIKNAFQALFPECYVELRYLLKKQ